MAVFIALLRAVNVGGTGRLPMSELRSACVAAGLGRVSTYIASGNLVFESGDSAAAVGRLLADLLSSRFGLIRNQPLIRTPDQLAGVIAGNPFADAAVARPNLLMVGFLEAVPHSGAGTALASYAGPERLHLDGNHLYIDYVEGVARSKLTPAVLDKALRLPATSRNWNTVNTLLGMARALETPA